MGSIEGNRKVAKNRKNHSKALFEGKKQAGLKPSRLKLARLDKGLTQLNICEKLDLKQASYAAIETGKRAVSTDRAKKIAKVLRRKVEEIFTKKSGDKYTSLIG